MKTENYNPTIDPISEQQIFYPYLRVSSRKQGKSGLSLEEQQDYCKRFIESRNGILGFESKEVQTATGKKKLPVLNNLVEHIKINGGVLLVSTLDRLTRDEIFFFTLQRSGIQFKCADMPDADSTSLAILAVLASKEAQKIKSRSQKAVDTKKKRIKIFNEENAQAIKEGKIEAKSLGNNTIKDFQQEATDKAAQLRKEDAIEVNKMVAGDICDLRNSYIKTDKGEFRHRTFNEVAIRLTEKGHKKQNGKPYDAKSVEVLYKRYCISIK